MSVFFDSPINDESIPEGEAELLLSGIGITEGIPPSESSEYRKLLAAVHDVAEHVLELTDYIAPTDTQKYPRESLHRPSQSEQQYGNAWAHKFRINGNASGILLRGKSVCLKDNIAVSGVPQFFGTDAIPAWTPSSDATVVQRVLEAGSTIVGTTICENFCNSTSSFTSAQGTVHNPYAKGFSAGGSTSGGSALVGGGVVDIAIGADQGGSIRVPASFCGCKYTPLHGSTNYGTELQSSVSGMKIGVLLEGFEHRLVDETVKDVVLNAAYKFRQLGATVEQVSLPLHLEGPAIWTIQQRIAGTLGLMGLSHGRRGLFSTEFEAARRPWSNESFPKLFPSTKNTIINGLSLMKNYPGLYAKTMNVAQQLRDSYEKLFQRYDIILMPTTPFVAPPNLDWQQGDSPTAALKPSMGITINTAIFDVTGHPAMTLPVGFAASNVDLSVKLPVGMQLVAGLWQEQKILDVGFAWESANDWKKVGSEDSAEKKVAFKL
ncbi:amidase [Massarina eburnea CBS 473.64]|uniref:Amidase n=1 Tax=Massarina eburnea CBS 473.64 TaxID=1395130 RepID=A0A6A6SE43_9PLEO|nr:amidase [Massarina eburnea CBS 473.64]